MIKFAVDLFIITQDKHKKLNSYKSWLKAPDDYMNKLESIRSCLDNNNLVSCLKSDVENMLKKLIVL